VEISDVVESLKCHNGHKLMSVPQDQGSFKPFPGRRELGPPP